ncbi:glycosyltransferase [Emticicia fluvialis]|uniref:glycosyltransferase n=1 Tax=Emticicia fluvialis TaxID=2974474 RepID=UPI002165597E|nr:hypothetical protein [Emticicia fluvialis]
MNKIFSKFNPPDPKLYFGTVIDVEHRIICLNSYDHLYSLSKLLSRSCKERIDIICGLWYSHESFKEVFKLVISIIRNKLQFPNITVHILCNTQKEYNILSMIGIKCTYCNHNAFIDETIFRIIPNQVKKYQAVYNAVLSEFKRHFLCEKVENLALVTYNFKNSEYKKYLDSILIDAHWLNYVGSTDNPIFLNNLQLCEIYNQSNVGLALSEIEGAMYSSAEYLLCGIPVVSTESKGGRDVFFTNENSVITKATTEDVVNAIKLAIEKKSGQSELIRSQMINMMEEHRDRFIKYVNTMYKNMGLEKDLKDTWEEWFTNKLRNEYSPEEIVGILSKG